MDEHSLPGGAISGAVRIGDTVHRRPGARAGFVHKLLGFFERAGWPGAPRFLGFDARGREIVSFVDGYVAWRPDASARASVTGEASLVRVAELVRDFHDLTAGSPLAGDQEGAEAGAARRGIELICDAYRLDGRDEIIDVIMWWQDRCWRGIEAGADAGDQAMVRLRDGGAVRDVRAAWDWVGRHRGELAGG
jgi:hypothetical protein